MASLIKRIFQALADQYVGTVHGGVALARRKGVKVGKNCRIYIRRFGSEPFLITMGDDVTITSGVEIITHDGSTGLVRNGDGRRYQRCAPVTIGNNVFIGVNSIILPGITIGSNVVIGAGSIVTRDIESNILAAGNPAKPIGRFEDFEARVHRDFVNDSELDGIVGHRERVERTIALAAERSTRPA